MKYHWKRYCTPRKSDEALDKRPGREDVDAAVAQLLGEATNAVLEVERIRELRCAVLLGEPGLGKSTVFRTLEERDRRSGRTTCLVTLRDYASREALQQDLFGLSALVSWQEGAGDLHLYLDSLDEGLLEAPRLHREILKCLQRLPRSARPRLYLRIACRSAHWPASFTGDIASVLEQEVAELRLEPLRPADVEEAAHQRLKVDAPAFLAYLNRDPNLQVLTGLPDTLSLLLETFAASGELPTRRADLFELGLIQLFHERSSSRREDGFAGALRDLQRRSIGARIAAATIFGNQSGVWTGGTAQKPPRWLPEARLCFEDEPAEGGEVAVTLAGVEETLHVGPYESRSDGRGFRWLNQVHGEFLAAWYLKMHDASADLACELLLNRQLPDPILAPQLANTAAWVADLVPGAWERLIELDPVSLLASDLSSRSEDERAALLTALLEGLDQDRFAIDRFAQRFSLYKLHYDPERMAESLRPWLRVGEHKEEAVRLAADVAADCKVTPLQADFLALARSPEASYYVRIDALRTLGGVTPEGEKPPMDGFLSLEASQDPDDELLGIALRHLWPRWLRADELFSFLRLPRRSSLFGAYRSFLFYELPPALRSEHDLNRLLTWIAEQDDQSRFQYDLNVMLQAALKRVGEHLQSPEVYRPLLRIVLNSDLEPQEGSSLGDFLDPRSPEGLEFIVNALYAAEECSKDAYDVGRHLPRWGVDVRAAWRGLAARFRQEPYPLFAEALRAWIDFYDEEHVATIIELSHEFPLIRERFGKEMEQFGTEPKEFIANLRRHHEEKQRELRERYSRHRPASPPPPPPAEQIQGCLRRIEEGKVGAWSSLIRELSRGEGEATYRVKIQEELVESPGWKAADEPTRARILAAAASFLAQESPHAEEWLDSADRSRVNTFVVVGLKAVELLARLDRERLEAMGQPLWRTWAAAIVAESGFLVQDRALKLWMAEQVRRHAAAEAADVMARLLQRDAPTYFAIGLFHDVDLYWSPALGEKLRDILLSSPPNAAGLRPLLQEMLRRGDESAREQALSWLAERQANPGSAERRRSVQVAAALLSQPPTRVEIWPLLEAEEVWAREVILDLAQSASFDEPILAEATTEDSARMLALLLRLYPPAAARRSAKGILGPQEKLGRYAENLVSGLIHAGTPASVNALIALRDQLGEAWPRLGWAVHQAREQAGMLTWEPLPPVELLRKIRADRYRRRVEPPLQPLYDLLLTIFDTPALVRIFAQTGLEAHLLQDLPAGNASLAEVAADYLARLRAGGLLTLGWVERLKGDYPDRSAEIDQAVSALGLRG